MYKKLLVALSFSCILGIPFLSLNAAEAAPPPRPPHHRGSATTLHHVIV